MSNKLIFAIIGLLFFGGQNLWTLIWGNPLNVIHVSGYTGSLWAFVAILAGVGLPTLAVLLPGLKPAEPKTPEPPK
jgi:hypothetical protein